MSFLASSTLVFGSVTGSECVCYIPGAGDAWLAVSESYLLCNWWIAAFLNSDMDAQHCDIVKTSSKTKKSSKRSLKLLTLFDLHEISCMFSWRTTFHFLGWVICAVKTCTSSSSVTWLLQNVFAPYASITHSCPSIHLPSIRLSIHASAI